MSRPIRHTRWFLAALGLAALTIPATATAGGQNQKFGPPDGWYGYAVSLPQQQRYGPPDGWYGYAVSLTRQQRQQTGAVLDGRSPDTIDAAIQAHSPVVTVVHSPGFQWGDFGIGGGAVLAAVLLLLLSTRFVSNRKDGSTPVPMA